MDMKKSVERVKHTIDCAAKISGRTSSDIMLVAASKYAQADMIKQAYDLGLRNFGENRVQEFSKKIPVLPSDINWHMIGRLQKNKVKYLIGNIALLHSLSDKDVAEEIRRLAQPKGVVVDCLIQLNIAREDSKSGIYEEDLEGFLDYLAPIDQVRVCGFMTMTPFDAGMDERRRIFSKTKKLSEDISQKRGLKLQFLSMGMSDDYEVAIEEGANIVRVGSAIFR